jgi:hypothetical protein
MSTIASQLLRETPLGTSSRLPRAGTSLENPWVYDAVGRELRELAKQGLIEVVAEREEPVGESRLLTDFEFKRVR